MSDPISGTGLAGGVLTGACAYWMQRIAKPRVLVESAVVC